MGKKIRIRQGKRHRIKLHVYVYVLIETNNTSFFPSGRRGRGGHSEKRTPDEARGACEW